MDEIGPGHRSKSSQAPGLAERAPEEIGPGHREPPAAEISPGLGFAIGASSGTVPSFVERVLGLARPKFSPTGTPPQIDPGYRSQTPEEPTGVGLPGGNPGRQSVPPCGCAQVADQPAAGVQVPSENVPRAYFAGDGSGGVVIKQGRSVFQLGRASSNPRLSVLQRASDVSHAKVVAKALSHKATVLRRGTNDAQKRVATQRLFFDGAPVPNGGGIASESHRLWAVAQNFRSHRTGVGEGGAGGGLGGSSNGTTGVEKPGNSEISDYYVPKRYQFTVKSITTYDLGYWRSATNNVAIYLRVGDVNPKIIFRWNNDGLVENNKTYVSPKNADSAGDIVIGMTAGTTISVQAYGWSGNHPTITPSALPPPWHKWPFSETGIDLGYAEDVLPGENGDIVLKTKTFSIVVGIVTTPLAPNGGDPKIVGLEVTQAIQHLWSEHGPNNTLPLIANKLTMVRVFVESGLSTRTNTTGIIGPITGVLNVKGTTNDGQSYETTVDPLGAEIVAQPDFDQIDRNNLWHSLNFFFIPPLAGITSLTAKIGWFGQEDSSSLELTILPTPKAVNVVPLRIFKSHLMFPALNLDELAKSTSPFKDTVSRQTIIDSFMGGAVDRGDGVPIWAGGLNYPVISSYYPLPPDRFNLQFGIFGDDLYALPDYVDDIITAVATINNDVNVVQHNSFGGPNRILMAVWPLLHFATYTGVMLPGENNTIVTSPNSMGHEIGHILGIWHNRNCGGVYPDINFIPADSSIWETGVDVANALFHTLFPDDPNYPNVNQEQILNFAIKDGAKSDDVMSYCNPKWICPYNWVKLLHGLYNWGFDFPYVDDPSAYSKP